MIIKPKPKLKPKLQPDRYSCGLYSIYNALKVLEIDVKLKDIPIKPHPKYGVDEAEMLFALKPFGLKPRCKTYKNLTKLKFPIIACINNNDHWVVIAGRLGVRWIVLDSEPTKGIVICSSEELMKMWKSSKNELFGIQL